MNFEPSGAVKKLTSSASALNWPLLIHQRSIGVESSDMIIAFRVEIARLKAGKTNLSLGVSKLD